MRQVEDKPVEAPKVRRLKRELVIKWLEKDEPTDINSVGKYKEI